MRGEATLYLEVQPSEQLASGDDERSSWCLQLPHRGIGGSGGRGAVCSAGCTNLVDVDELERGASEWLDQLRVAAGSASRSQ
jgi:hypothetical protein